MTAAPELEIILRWVGDRTGLQFPDYRREAVVRVVRRTMTNRRAKDPADYLALIQQNPAAFDELVDLLTIGETYFFREPAQFEAIRQTVLPEILARRGTGPVRAWSAACSTGEEAYSLAALFLEAGLEKRAEVLATDLSTDALARARRGEYREWSLRGDGGRRMAPYFVQTGGVRTVDDRLRRMVRFERLNLFDSVYPRTVLGSPPDLILCRNVLIYFDAETVTAVSRKLHDALAPGGWLITASCDPPLSRATPFARVTTPAGIVYRRELTPVVDWTTPLPPSLVASPEPSVLFSPPLSGRVRVRGETSLPERLLPDPGSLTPHPNPPAQGGREQEKTGRKQESTEADTLEEVRIAADRNPEAAERTCAEAAGRFPLSVELRLTHAMLLLGLGRLPEAVRAARGAVFLAPDSAVGQHLLGLILCQSGDANGAVRAFRQARDLASARPTAEPARFGHGETVGQLAQAAEAQLARLAAGPGGAS